MLWFYHNENSALIGIASTYLFDGTNVKLLDVWPKIGHVQLRYNQQTPYYTQLFCFFFLVLKQIETNKSSKFWKRYFHSRISTELCNLCVRVCVCVREKVFAWTGNTSKRRKKTLRKRCNESNFMLCIGKHYANCIFLYAFGTIGGSFITKPDYIIGRYYSQPVLWPENAKFSIVIVFIRIFRSDECTTTTSPKQC